MAAASTTTVPLEEYLHSSYEHDREWVNGELKERGVPDELHSTLQQFFLVYFSRIGRDLGLRIRPELRIQIAASRFRIPDVAVLRADAPFQPFPTEPPLLCVEILSEDDRAQDLQEKIDDYVSMGVQAIWIVDPRRRRMMSADAAGIHNVQEFVLPGTAVRITPEELFAELDELEKLRP